MYNSVESLIVQVEFNLSRQLTYLGRKPSTGKENTTRSEIMERLWQKETGNSKAVIQKDRGANSCFSVAMFLGLSISLLI